MASKRVGSNEFGLKTGLGKKMSHYNQVRNWSGWVELYFSHEFFYLLKKKKTCICHLVCHVANYFV